MSTNKILFIIAGFLVVVVFVFTVSLLFFRKPSTPPGTETPSSTPQVQPTTSYTEPQTQTQIQTQIKTEIKPEIDKRVDIDYQISKVKTYGDEWAIVEIASPVTDNARVVVKKENSQWVVMTGPGTYFDEEELIEINAPQSLINEINSTL